MWNANNSSGSGIVDKVGSLKVKWCHVCVVMRTDHPRLQEKIESIRPSRMTHFCLFSTEQIRTRSPSKATEDSFQEQQSLIIHDNYWFVQQYHNCADAITWHSCDGHWPQGLSSSRPFKGVTHQQDCEEQQLGCNYVVCWRALVIIRYSSCSGCVPPWEGTRSATGAFKPCSLPSELDRSRCARFDYIAYAEFERAEDE